MDIHKAKATLINAAVVLALFSFVSRVLGVLRDRIIASKFGAVGTVDAYYAAFRIPDFVFNLLILGALSSAFVPVFTSYLAHNNKKKAFETANSLINLTLVVLVVVSAILYIAMPYVVSLITAGFDSELRELTVKLSRILLLSPIFFGLSNILSGILNSFKRFTAYALAPIFYNIGIIIGAYFLTDLWGIYGLVVGVIIGSIAHFLVQLPSAIKCGFKYAFYIRFHEGVKKIGKLMIPRTVGIGMMQINLFVTTSIATTLPEGSVTIFNLANNVHSFPIGIFGISFALSAFPFLAEAVSKNDAKGFKYYFANAFSKILIFIIPLSILIWILREQIIRIFFGAGNFDWTATLITAQTLGYFAMGLFASALIPLIARAFYATHNTKTPVIISVVSMVINIAASLLLAPRMGVPGLALAYSIAAIIQCVLLFIFLRQKAGSLDGKRLFNQFVKILAAGVVLYIVAAGIMELSKYVFDLKTFMGVFLETSIVTVSSAVLYVFLLYLFKDEEVRAMIEGVVVKIKKLKKKNG
ncbi:murein biosynthesis integral membrane protein MurJ [Patescibacteria group bacterium]|nr:murein biosynthesis integral membrane protein MurJ [Patescibacteria group bacterium]